MFSLNYRVDECECIRKLLRPYHAIYTIISTMKGYFHGFFL